MKRIVSLILILMMLCSGWSTAFADYKHLDGNHERDYKYVLFENGKVPNEKKKQFDALADGLYLCIDWFDSAYKTGLDDYKYLIKIFPAVKRVVKSADEMRYSASGSTHRSYSHRGWHFTEYPSKYHWTERKRLLLATVYCCIEGSPLLGFGLEKQMTGKRYDSLAALLYCVHVLGDHIEDREYKNMAGNGNGLKMAFVTEHPGDTNRDLLYDLEESILTLFPDNKEAEELRHELERVRSEESDSMKRYQGILTEEEQTKRFEQHQENVANALELLVQRIPGMLAKEEWFQEAFEK